MRLIDTTYFDSGLETELENITTVSGVVSAKTQFESFITLKEVAYLETMFGYELAKAIIAAIDAGGTLPDRMDRIINGYEFRDWAGVLQKWKGLTRTDKTSPVADYVYWYWRKRLISNTSTEGNETQPEIESSKIISPVDKMVTNWNHGVQENRYLWWFMRANASLYPEYTWFRYPNQESKRLLNPENSIGL